MRLCSPLRHLYFVWISSFPAFPLTVAARYFERTANTSRLCSLFMNHGSVQDRLFTIRVFFPLVNKEPVTNSWECVNIWLRLHYCRNTDFFLLHASCPWGDNGARDKLQGKVVILSVCFLCPALFHAPNPPARWCHRTAPKIITKNSSLPLTHIPGSNTPRPHSDQAANKSVTADVGTPLLCDQARAGPRRKRGRLEEEGSDMTVKERRCITAPGPRTQTSSLHTVTQVCPATQ